MEGERESDQFGMGFWKELNVFCSTTTAHGFVNFTGDDKQKRLFWGIICLGKNAGLRLAREHPLLVQTILWSMISYTSTQSFKKLKLIMRTLIFNIIMNAAFQCDNVVEFLEELSGESIVMCRNFI